MATRYEITLANFAFNRGLNTAEALVLPGIVDAICNAQSIKKADLARELAFDPTTELADYVATACETAAQDDAVRKLEREVFANRFGPMA